MYYVVKYADRRPSHYQADIKGKTAMSLELFVVFNFTVVLEQQQKHS